MNHKQAVITGNKWRAHQQKLWTTEIFFGSVIFLISFVLLAAMLGNADVVSNPLIPNRVL